ERRGWPLALIASAITAHFLAGAVAGANLPALYRRFGASTATKAGALALALGTIGWAAASAPWQLFVAALPSGAARGAMSAVAVNGIVSPWFVRPPGRARDGVQRRERGRRDLLAALGRRNRDARLSRRRGRDRIGHGGHHVGARVDAVFPHSATD